MKQTRSHLNIHSENKLSSNCIPTGTWWVRKQADLTIKEPSVTGTAAILAFGRQSQECYGEFEVSLE